MKWKPDKTYRTLGITAFLVVAASMLFYFLLFRTSTLGSGLSKVVSVLNPIIYGYIIAYILNPVMTVIENSIYKIIKKAELHPGKKRKKAIRIFSVFAALFLGILVVYGIVSSVLPELIRSVRSIIVNFQTYSDNVNTFISETFHNPEIDETTSAIIGEVTDRIQSFFSSEMTPLLDTLASNVTSSLVGFATFIKNIILGIVISLYVLIAKEGLITRFRRFLYAMLPTDQANRTLHNLRFADEKFGGFLIGKIIDSVIIGFICYFMCLILKMPYAILISVIIGVTNVIPFFGPFIGAIPCTFLVFVVDPVKALIFVIFILCLQQFDGNFLGPKILGSSVGVSSYMVILAILIGGGFFGVAGMVVGVPLCALLTAAVQGVILRRMKAKGFPGDLESYHYVQQINPLTGEFNNETAERKDGSLYDRIRYRGPDVRSFDEPVTGRTWDRTMEQVEEWDAEISGTNTEKSGTGKSAGGIFVDEETL